MRSTLALLFFLALPAPAIATDGVLEISQTCAVNTGCFSGDTSGFPVTISASGSYRLTSSLNIPSPEVTAIVVGSDDVAIDLNGFSILGNSGCSGDTTPATCPSPGAGHGIFSEHQNTSISNGTIRGMGYSGIKVSGRGSKVMAIQLISNRGDGVGLDDKCLVSESLASGNGSAGFRIGWWCVVEGNRSTANGLQGIAAGSESIIRGNTVGRNGNRGIDADDGCLISDNVVGESGDMGIHSDRKSTIHGNTVRDSAEQGISGGAGCTIADNTVNDNIGHGIEALSGSSVQRNTVRNNSGYGLNLSADTSYRENTITNNVTGTVTGSGVNMGDNYCAETSVGSTPCP